MTAEERIGDNIDEYGFVTVTVVTSAREQVIRIPKASGVEITFENGKFAIVGQAFGTPDDPENVAVFESNPIGEEPKWPNELT